MTHIKEIIGLNMDALRKKTRRYKVLTFNVHVPFWVFAKAWEAMPKETYVLACDHDNFKATNTMLLWSPEFERVHEATAPPEIFLEVHDDKEEVSIFEIDKDGSFNYWKPPKPWNPGQREIQI